MKDVIGYIDELKKKAISGKADLDYIRKLNFLKKLASCISECEKVGSVDSVIPLCDMSSGYSEYRIVNDCESDNRELWVEYKYRNKIIRLDSGDLIIKMK
ncbi:hypothetical protein ACLEDV_09055 [Lonsdalea quercina]|uniref:hypothetical protein n=1 Tax=Lonsdalea quercina TaxID=71657 RepID=UPI00397716A5